MVEPDLGSLWGRLERGQLVSRLASETVAGGRLQMGHRAGVLVEQSVGAGCRCL